MPVDVELIKHRVKDVEKCISELKRLASIPFAELTQDQIYSMRYNIIVLVESLVSIAIHILVEEYNYKPEYYAEALRELASKLSLKQECIEELKALVKLRNLLVHRYWIIDDRRVHDEVRRNFKCIEELLDKIRGRYGED